jgi:DMSO/TMAO reductase YedYZ molybdopterin-dependent catalytic subunit
VRTRVRAAVAGVAAVAVALGVSELLAGLFAGVPSLVTSVGSLLIPVIPPAIEQWAIRTFGTSDKAILNLGTTVLTLAVGVAAGRRGLGNRRAGAAVIVALAAVGLAAALLTPLRSPVGAVLAVLTAAGSGVLVLERLLARVERPTPVAEPTPAEPMPAAVPPPDVQRRRFLAATAGALAAAAVFAATGVALRRAGGAVETAARELPEPARAAPLPGSEHAFADVDGLAPIEVPNDRFYRIDTALRVPRVDPEMWRLRVTGMVDEEVELTYDDLLEMALVERWVTLACVSNEVGGDLVGNARWLGVPLDEILDLAGVRPGATQVVGRAVDGWTAGFPTEAVFDGRPALVAVGMNGAPLPRQHGFPARLVVAGLYGYVSATKWLTEIELTTWEAFDAYWVPRGWSKEGPVRMSSRIDVPRADARVPVGEVLVAGVAWAPGHGVERVELQVDDGAWEACETTEPLAEAAWVQWRRTVDLAAGEHLVRVRMIDGRGRLQVERRSPPPPAGATGHHTIRLRSRG